MTQELTDLKPSDLVIPSKGASKWYHAFSGNIGAKKMLALLVVEIEKLESLYLAEFLGVTLATSPVANPTEFKLSGMRCDAIDRFIDWRDGLTVQQGQHLVKMLEAELQAQ